MNISVDEVLDFVACSALHQFRYIDIIDVSKTAKLKRANRQSIIEQYDKALHKAASFLFHSMQQGVYPGLHHLSKRWGYLWVQPRSEQEDVRFREASWRDTHEQKRKEGWIKLSKLWEHYRDQSFTPIMIDYQYTLPIGRHTLTGVIDLVRVVRGGNGREHIELVEFLQDDKSAPFLHAKRDWRVTAAAYAFRKLMNVTEEKIVYHGLISGKLIQTSRQEDDFKQLERLLDSIENMRKIGVSIPVFNERCLTCTYQKHCEKGWYTDAKN
ncbi:PD-(D/E)XK nuclease family protein (plasmid) [Paenibacillus sp. EC2-1]|uniref:PD-(D/E)XK nuclease family protein n=1 Tax=Paenibacillus sp. EC2-1 TaxID=3388665 RepID=UPI003BEEB9DA